MSSTSLLSTQSLVATPYVSVTIGKYTFGVFDGVKSGSKKYPNYINKLEVTKINGQVNQYTLSIIYQITENDDPNYFERVFSSVSNSRKIEFTYGDMSSPSYMYRNEEAMITKVESQFNLEQANITYTVSAVSTGNLLNSGTFSFDAVRMKPSERIEWLCKNTTYNLQEVFTGMRNWTIVSENNLIPSNDVEVNIEAKTNCTTLEYLSYLVSMMTTSTSSSAKNKSFFVLKYCDDTSGIFGGSYFEIKQVDSNIEHAEAYELDIGYKGTNMVTNFNVENNENYSIYYDYAESINPNQYVQRIGPDGEIYEEYAPIISSGNDEYKTTEHEKSWWAKLTQYPIKCSVTIKGLLRPAILMSYVRLKVLFYGTKHVVSGLYIITKQVDSIDSSGYSTTLNMTRIAEDDNFI